MIHQDLFYNFNNSWRQQGASLDFGFNFGKYIRETDFSLFTSRLNSGNGANIADRVFVGGNVKVIQSDFFKVGLTHISLIDIAGTSNRADTTFRNPVTTASFQAYAINTDSLKVSLRSEFGSSRRYTQNDTITPAINDFFVDIRARGEVKKLGLTAEVGYIMLVLILEHQVHKRNGSDFLPDLEPILFTGMIKQRDSLLC
jgi:hypothetical protein